MLDQNNFLKLVPIIWLTLTGSIDVAVGQPAPEGLTLQVKIISLSQDTATALCPKPSETNTRTTTEVSGAIKAELPVLVKRVVDAGGQVAAKYENSTSQGVLESDLASLVKSANDCRVKVFMFLTEKLLGGPPPTVVENRAIAQSTPIVASQSQATVSPLILRDGPTIRVFPKVNLTQRETIALAKLLPSYSVQTGRSNIDESNYADTLFVNRDRITPDEIVETSRALAQLGVYVKSIQQSSIGGRREIQVGTSLDPVSGTSLYESRPPIDFEKLAKLSGIEFWKQSYNGGPVICIIGLGTFEVCEMDANGRPARSN